MACGSREPAAKVRAGAVPEWKVSDAGRVLGAAFQDEPVMCWLIPDRLSRTAVLSVFFTWLTVEVFLNDGRVDVLTTDGTVDGTAGGGGAVGVALWLDRFGFGSAVVGSGADPSGVLEELGAAPDRTGALMDALGRAHPGEDHEYLFFAGVLPGRQRHGLGSRLLRQAHERLDRDGVGAYLEATSPASRALYTGLGYRDHGESIRLPDGPTIWPMWRAPEASRAVGSTASRVAAGQPTAPGGRAS